MAKIKKQRFIKEFRPDLSTLTKTEKKVVEKLVAAAKLIAVIYQKQLGPNPNMPTFYPKDISKEELEEAARQNVEILSPYTFVERRNSQLIATPYHIKYRDDLLPIAKLLKEAAKLTDNKSFARRLILQANALLDGAYEASIIYWLTMKPYKIDIVIGPNSRYDDKLFLKKTTYEAWVGVMAEEPTNEALKFKELFASAKRKALESWDQIEIWNKLQLRVDKTIVHVGFISRSHFTGYNLPDDPFIIEKYGSEITFFEPSLNIKFKTRHYPIFKHVFDPQFQKLFSKDELQKADFRNIIIHELGHPLLRFKHAEDRLKELFPVFDEIAASIVGIKNVGTLVLKDFISEKELEAILVIFICWALDWEEEIPEMSLNVEPFLKGNAIALNYLFQSGAIKEIGGISWPNFTKMFMALDSLSELIEKIIAHGTYQEAKSFIEKFGSLDVFRRFNLKERIS